LIEQGYLLVVRYPMMFEILRSTVMMRLSGAVVGVSYATQNFTPDLELPSMQSTECINQV
jgi:hypothetical protein